MSRGVRLTRRARIRTVWEDPEGRRRIMRSASAAVASVLMVLTAAGIRADVLPPDINLPWPDSESTPLAEEAASDVVMQDSTIGTMPVGTAGYVTGWTPWMDSQGDWWLNPASSIHSSPGGTVEVKVEHWEDGYHIWPLSEPPYKLSGEPPADFIPVQEAHR